MMTILNAFRRGRRNTMIGGILAAAAMNGLAMLPAHAQTLSPNMPFDVSSLPNPSLQDWNGFAWQSFVAANWPVAQGTRGVPDPSQKIGAVLSDGSPAPRGVDDQQSRLRCVSASRCHTEQQLADASADRCMCQCTGLQSADVLCSGHDIEDERGCHDRNQPGGFSRFAAGRRTGDRSGRTISALRHQDEPIRISVFVELPILQRCETDRSG